MEKNLYGINYIELDEESVINSLMPEIQTPPFGYEKKLIIVKHSGLFKKETKAKVSGLKELRETLENYLKENQKQMQEGVVLVFSEDSVDKLNITKTVEAVGGTICQFAEQKPFEIEKKLIAICGVYKVQVESGAMKALIDISGTNMQSLINEVRKLIEYTGEGGTITKESVYALAIKTLDSNIFDLTDSIGQKNIKKALDILYQKEAIQKILITLYNHLKKVYIVKIAEKYKKDPAVFLNLKPNQTFLINKYKSQAKYFSENEIRKVLDDMIELDTNYKIGLIDVNIGTETLLASLAK